MAAVKVGASGAAFLSQTAASTVMSGGYGQSATAGNLLVMGVVMSAAKATATSCTTPTGWTAGPVSGAPTGTAAYKGALFTFWRVAAGGDTGPAVTVAGGTYSTAIVIEEFSGITNVAVEAVAPVVTKNTSATVDADSLAGSITTTVDPCLVWSFFGGMISFGPVVTAWGASTTSYENYFGVYVQTSTASRVVAPGTYSVGPSWPGASATVYGVSLASIAFKAGAGGGGTNYTSTPADPVALTDSTALTLAAARSQADTVGLTDVVDAVLTPGGGANLTDTVNLTDAASTAIDAARAPADPVALTDAVTTTSDATRTQADPVGVTDSVTVQLDRVVTVADTVGLTDTATPTLTGVGSATLADTVGVTDVASWTASTTRANADPVGISDAVTVVMTRVVTLADLIGMTDTATMGAAVIIPIVRHPRLTLNLPRPGLTLNLPRPGLTLNLPNPRNELTT